jgi:hypothetical protein
VVLADRDDLRLAGGSILWSHLLVKGVMVNEKPTDIEAIAYSIAYIFGAPWRRNVVRQLGIITSYYTLRH